jgi:hypothetical protein
VIDVSGRSPITSSLGLIFGIAQQIIRNTFICVHRSSSAFIGVHRRLKFFLSGQVTRKSAIEEFLAADEER